MAVAAYMPLHSMPAPASLLARSWPAAVESVLDQQVREPVAERQHRESIAQLTPIANDVSVLVERQYVENPYPRWVEPAPADRTDAHLAGCPSCRAWQERAVALSRTLRVREVTPP